MCAVTLSHNITSAVSHQLCHISTLTDSGNQAQHSQAMSIGGVFAITCWIGHDWSAGGKLIASV